ncbi:MAG: polysaccharide biosynthesis tyrosine autokinase [Candidatus Fermentibacteraceae bacterium]|nr:polysaccharide biosynthesis tyrosine autokinase [Candidatus Fermentibacteraceae bacterium]MBN2609730.1 polysaccharide biosynthesis tyrosine autokinase [Candidatus Fermentibacteraceae bacterium]
MNDRALQDERESIDISEYLWLLYHNKWIILAFLVVSVVASIWITAKTRPVYRSSATFIYDLSSSMTQTLNMSNVLWFEMDPMRNNQIQIIHSRSMAEAVADSILRSPNTDSLLTILYADLGVPQDNLRGSLVGLVRGSISVSNMKDTDFFVLSATGYSPAASATMVNLVVQTYYKKNLTDTRGENTMVKLFLAEQLEFISAELASAEDSLTSFKEEYGIVSLSTETSQIVQSLSSFETSAARSRTEQGALEAQRSYFESQLEAGRSELAEDIASTNSALISQLENDIATLESTRASLVSRGTGEEENVIQDLDSQISARREALARALREVAYSRYPYSPAQSLQNIVSEMAGIEAELRAERIRESVLRSIIVDLEDSISVLPELELRLARLERNWTVSEDIYLLLRTKYEEVRIAEAGQIGNVTIVDTALPGGMIKPNRRRNLILGIFAGLAAGVGFIFLKEQLDSSVKNPEDIEHLDIPVVGVIPRVSRSDVLTGEGRQGLIMMTAPRQAASEAYRDLRTSLRFSATDGDMRSILVTSAGPREGKSTTVGNLAVAFAQTGSSVLIVDTDMRRPVMHKIFNVPREPGFSEAMAGLNPVEETIKATGVENLSVLTCGYIPHNPSELLGSGRFREFLARLEEEFDIVILDSPPVAVVTDPIVISPEVDATLMVAGVKKIDRKVLKSAWDKLKRGTGRCVGAVLNGFDPANVYTSYSYYSYKYHYYYQDDVKKKRKTRDLSRKRPDKRN